MRQGFGRFQIALFALWGVAFFSFFIGLAAYSSPKPPQKPSGPLKVFTGDGKVFAELNREKAVEFGLEKLYSTVNYLLLASAAILGFTIKSVMEAAESAKTSAAPEAPPTRVRLLLFLHAGIASVFSLCSGVMAYFYFANISTREEFCLTGELNICLWVQIGTLLTSILLLLAALASVVRDLLP